MIGNAVKLGFVGCAALITLSAAGRFAVGQKGDAPQRRTRQIQAVNSSGIIAARSPEPNKISAISLTRGVKWKTYTAPPGTRLTAIASNEIVALAQDGPDVKELAVFESFQGEWKTHPLPEPAKHAVSPHILNDVAVFAVGKHLYAYRGKGMYWSARDLPSDDPPVVQVVPNAFLVQQGKTLYVYSTINGTWSDGADVEPAVEIGIGGGRGFQSISPRAP